MSTETTLSTRKPYNQNAGYVASLKCKLGGYIVIYDRSKVDIDADHRWIVMHEPSTRHVAVPNLPMAREIMKLVARANSYDEARLTVDILPDPAIYHS